MLAWLEGCAAGDHIRRGKVLEHQILVLGILGQQLGRDRLLQQVQVAPAKDLDLIVDHALFVLGHELERTPDGGIVGIDAPLVTVSGLQGVGIGAVEHGIHGRITGCPVIPAQIPLEVGNLGLKAQLVVQLGLHRQRLAQGPPDVQIVLIVWVVRRRAGLDQHRIVKAVQVQQDHGIPLGDDAHHGPGLGLRLRDKVAVQVESVGVGAGVQHAPVRVGHHVDQQDDAVQNRLYLLALPVGQRLDQLDGGIDAGIFRAMDAGIDKEGDLKVAKLLDHVLGLLGIGQHHVTDGLILAQAAHRLGIGEGDQEEVAPARRLADDVDPDAAAVGLDLAQPGLDLGVGDGVVGRRHDVAFQ